MTRDHDSGSAPRVVLGTMLVALGALFTLDKLGIIDTGDYWEFWPLVFVFVGVGKVLQPGGTRGRGAGLLFILVGVWWLLYNLHYVQYHVLDLWPVLLVLIGMGMVWRAVAGGRRPFSGDPGGASFWQSRQVTMEDHGKDTASGTPVAGPWWNPGGDAAPGDGVNAGPSTPGSPAGSRAEGSASAVPGTVGTPLTSFAPGSARGGSAGSDTLHVVAVMGGVNRSSSSADFRGGDITAIMAGCKIDLRYAAIAGGEAVLDVVAFWGGVEIFVPQSWRVVMKATPLLGSAENRNAQPGPGTGPALIVRGTVIMGGVEVRN